LSVVTSKVVGWVALTRGWPLHLILSTSSIALLDEGAPFL
jgi:hypothetical protein